MSRRKLSGVMVQPLTKTRSRPLARIDKSALTIAEHERVRDPKYLAWLRKQPCCSCGKRAPSEAHHIKGAQPRGKGIKSGDDKCIPLCGGPQGCHAQAEQITDSAAEDQYWLHRGIDVIREARWYRHRYDVQGVAVL
jgi:hypothetical protein